MHAGPIRVAATACHVGAFYATTCALSPESQDRVKDFGVETGEEWVIKVNHISVERTSIYRASAADLSSLGQGR